MNTDRYPLGEPVNRKPSDGPVPVEGRPGWFHDRRGGEPFYVEPTDPPVSPPPERQAP